MAVELTLSVVKTVDVLLIVDKVGERGPWLGMESLIHSRVKKLISKRDAVSVVQMRKEAKGLAA